MESSFRRFIQLNTLSYYKGNNVHAVNFKYLLFETIDMPFTDDTVTKNNNLIVNVRPVTKNTTIGVNRQFFIHQNATQIPRVKSGSSYE